MGHTPPISDRLRADGNLTYLGFMSLIENLWAKAHPSIPFYAVGTAKEDVIYPNIVYSLEMREPFSGEKKPRFREGIPTLDSNLIVSGWRFRNFVQFMAQDDQSPKRADDTIEAFEDFMLEHTPVFKRLGISDLFYGRREPDKDIKNTGDSIAVRTLTYIVVTEKIITVSRERLEQIEIDARTHLEASLLETIESSVGAPHTKQHIHYVDALLV